LADKIYTGGLTIDGSVVKIDGSNLVIRVQGRDTTRDIAKVQRLEIDGEPAFTDAEKAYATARAEGTAEADRKAAYEKAVEGYQKAVKSSNKEWLRDWSALRLVDAAAKANRFDAAVTGWISLVLKDPELASKYKPALPDERSAFLNSAAVEVQGAANGSKVSDAARSQLLGFLLDLHRARKDDTAAGKVAEQIMKAGGDVGSDPAAARAMGDLRLNLAKIALDRKDYDKALSEIESSKALLVEPPQQAEAMYVIAECANGKLGDKTDAQAVRDVALAYMRVVAHFKDVPAASPRVADSLFKTAQLLERAASPFEATRLYEQVASQYKDSPAAVKANEALTRLKDKAAKKES